MPRISSTCHRLEPYWSRSSLNQSFVSSYKQYLALRMPPDLVVDGVEFFSDALLVRIGWPATLSVGVALFGANALAAYEAIEKQK
jgi:hypothetical protein